MKIILTILIILLPSLYFGYIGKPAEMGLSIVAGALAGAFINLDKFERFSGAGFEAEMRKVVEEAYATVENLKEVAKPLFSTTLANLTYANRLGGMGIKESHQYKKQIEDLAKSLTLSDDKELIDIFTKFHNYHTWDFYSQFVDTIYNETKNIDLRNNLQKFMDYSTSNFPDLLTIQDILKINEIEINEVTNEKLEEYIYYLNNKKIK